MLLCIRLRTYIRIQNVLSDYLIHKLKKNVLLLSSWWSDGSSGLMIKFELEWIKLISTCVSTLQNINHPIKFPTLDNVMPPYRILGIWLVESRTRRSQFRKPLDQIWSLLSSTINLEWVLQQSIHFMVFQDNKKISKKFCFKFMII